MLERRKLPHPEIPGREVNHYDCRHLHRWPLGTMYPAIVVAVSKLTRAVAAASTTAPPTMSLVVHAAGVGRPVVNMFRRAKLSAKLQAVVITAGQRESFVDGYHRVAKTVLISGPQVLLQQRRLKFAPSLPETPTLIKELQNYRVKISQAANEIFNAREGEHDDLVLALALACWWGERRKWEFRC